MSSWPRSHGVERRGLEVGGKYGARSTLPNGDTMEEKFGAEKCDKSVPISGGSPIKLSIDVSTEPIKHRDRDAFLGLP